MTDFTTTRATPHPKRIFLNVPYSEKGDVKASGAVWDQAQKAWWVSHPEHLAIARWGRLEVDSRNNRVVQAALPPAPSAAPKVSGLQRRQEGLPEALAIVKPLDLPHVAPIAASTNIWLDVPQGLEAEAIALGANAHYGENNLTYFSVESREHPAFVRWGRVGPLDPEMAGEDRKFGAALGFDLGTEEARTVAIAQYMSPPDWRRLRDMATRRAGKTCELCGASGSPRMKVLGRWEYDDKASVKTLKRVILVCEPCHKTSERGLTTGHGVDKVVESHLLALFPLTAEQVADWWAFSWLIWQDRKTRPWTVDLALLTDNGLAVLDAPTPAAAGEGRQNLNTETAAPAVRTEPTVAPELVPVKRRGLFGFGR